MKMHSKFYRDQMNGNWFKFGETNGRRSRDMVEGRRRTGIETYKAIFGHFRLAAAFIFRQIATD